MSHDSNLGHVDIAEALIATGADVNDANDSHQFAPIGGASQFAPPRAEANATAILNRLRAHGAKHHVFSAIAAGSIDELREVLPDNANALQRRSPTL